MEYELSEAPEGYTWELGTTDGPFMGTEGVSYEVKLSKNGKVVETRGVFVPKAREAETASFIKAMEQSIRMSLAN
ncbi:hypothetical protein AXJ18_gp107 [Streptomyces phage Jay2Jay]|uniref:Uncharacterized protein n=2 Tax=Samistivirus jay2jay TaxID=2560786 RepID=A0A221SB70_9CAUD|nr:hypothetical protein AXJ18_gp107 [Streptomyces phage Jay2Jay]AIW02667.1 hypothetical protein PBI_JAY2JAY_212 [Streptomyces phage Jay2Jay]ASN73242.1 hypothetical protein SEA_WARPY_210 [Streptomyces phage Warpy]UEM46953.1 hypothetical protein SEA_TARGARYEN_206 [Streptomyces phage Targaryen]